MLFDDYVSDVREPEVTLPSAALNFSQPGNGGREWAEQVFDARSQQSRRADRWSSAPGFQQRPQYQDYTMKNEVPEREVFEL